jgi:hypothetical protein
MNRKRENQTTTEIAAPNEEHSLRIAEQVTAAPTLADKSHMLWALPTRDRHEALGLLPASLVAGLIESDPDRNIALLANIPAQKFHEITNLGTSEQGRDWLERAVTSGSLAATILPSLFTSRALADMLLTDPEVRRAIPNLLNFKRAERWRLMLTTSEWAQNRSALLMSDVDELLAKAPFRNKAIKAVMQSLLDFIPELYLETVTVALERVKYAEDRPDEYENLTSAPLDLSSEVRSTYSADERADAPATSQTPVLEELIPDGNDPVFALATAGLSTARKALLEEQLRHLLRQEIVATASFSQAGMLRAMGRVLFYLRAGLESFGPSVEDATRSLERHDLHEISAAGARTAEAFRQRALAITGMRDWLDGRQKQFLDALKQPEAGVHPQTREPVLWLSGRPKQPREEWHPAPLAAITQRLDDIGAWVALARAAFGTPERVHTIFNTAKTRTSEEALRRTVMALALYKRWEPELVRPSEDHAAFVRQYLRVKDKGLEAVRKVVIEALDETSVAAWKPSDAKERARSLLLRTVDMMEDMPPPAPPQARARR